MATPHVVSGIALYASTHCGSSAAQMKDAILSNAVPTDSLKAKCITSGHLTVGDFRLDLSCYQKSEPQMRLTFLIF
jgi:hypothetical protein